MSKLARLNFNFTPLRNFDVCTILSSKKYQKNISAGLKILVGKWRFGGSPDVENLTSVNSFLKIKYGYELLLV